jgi:hypothetical protein
MKRSLQASLALVLATSALCASAQAPTSSPAKKELIAKFLVMQQPGIEQLSRVLLQQPLGPLMQGVGGMIQQLPPEKREATAKAIEAEIKKFVEDNAPLMKDKALKVAPTITGPLLDERYTEEELRQIVTWLESPVSKKFSQSQGDLQKAMADKLMAELGPTLDTRYKALQAAIAKELGVSVPSATSAPKAAPAAKPASAPAKK